MEQHNWNSIDELFDRINESCNYLVMRNYECMDSEEIFTKGHEDIDILCDDYKKMVKVTDARPRSRVNNGVQYYILLKGQKLKIDLRHTGDGYYDPKWQENIIKKRMFHEFGFYVMDEKDYFYSLIYHSVLQKNKLSEDYRIKLSGMAKKLGINADNEEQFIKALDDYMIKEGYYYTYPVDCTVPNRFFLIDKKRTRGYYTWWLRKLRHLPLRAIRFAAKFFK